MLEEFNLPRVVVSLFTPPGSLDCVGDNVTQVHGLYCATQRSACLRFPFNDTRLNFLMVFTVFGRIMEKGWKERSVWHCVLAMYCSSGARSEQHSGCPGLPETGTGRCWGAGEGCLSRCPCYCLCLIHGTGV